MSPTLDCLSSCIFYMDLTAANYVLSSLSHHPSFSMLGCSSSYASTFAASPEGPSSSVLFSLSPLNWCACFPVSWASSIQLYIIVQTVILWSCCPHPLHNFSIFSNFAWHWWELGIVYILFSVLPSFLTTSRSSHLKLKFAALIYSSNLQYLHILYL